MEYHRHLDDELNSLRDRVLLLGGEVEGALQRAMVALVERDSDLARGVLNHDDAIDRIEVEIDRQCIDIIALRQPAARDLRFVISVAKMAPVLERIADHACNIARAAIDLNNEPELKPAIELQQMAEHASSMLRAALDAFTSNDPRAAREV
ncbi:MAG: phosphate signaling complex protein PhoU, partial [Pyrinomonadaceae bacterium]